MTDVEIEHLFDELEQLGEDTRRVIQRLGESTARRVEDILTTRHGHRQVTLGKATIVENENKWTITEKGYDQPGVISNAVLRLDECLVQQSTGKRFFKGRVLYGDDEVSFCEAASALEKDTFKWMEKLLLENMVKEGHPNRPGVSRDEAF